MDIARGDSPTSCEAKTPSQEKAQPYSAYNDAEAVSSTVTPIDIRTKTDAGFDEEELKRTIRKVDWRLLPILGALYSISLIDRGNLALARAAGMDKTLELSVGNRYSITVLTFFATYIVFEYPSSFGLRHFGAAKWLGTASLFWGLTMLSMGFVEDWKTLAGLRAVLGVFESVIFPGSVYLLSSWYPRHQTQKRISVFFAIAYVTGGLSSIIGYALSLIKMYKGQGWRSILIIEGIVTILISFASFFLICDFPDKAKFLNEAERKMILTRIDRDRADAQPDAFTWAKFFAYLKEIKIWASCVQFFTSTLTTYSLGYFLPTILKSMGFTTAESLLLIAPPAFFSIIPALICAYYSDKTCVRTPFIAFACALSIIGTCLYTYTSPPGVRYFGIFVAVSGASASAPLITGYSQILIRAQSKRAYTSAAVIGSGGIGGIAAALSFTQKEAPKYSTGVALTLGFNALTILICLVQHLTFRYQNARADKGKIVLEGDEAFRYQL